MKYLILILTFSFLTPTRVRAQCLCADIIFTIILPDIIFDQGHSNYSIHYLNNDANKSGVDEIFEKSDLNGDTLIIRFPTNGGLDTLSFKLSNLVTKAEMKVTVLYMGPDRSYLIDLTEFTKGEFLFDWQRLSKCLRENLGKYLIECDNLKFFQLELNANEINYKIRPMNLLLFK